MDASNLKNEIPLVEELSFTPSPSTEYPTIWGLSPVELHDRYWASLGVQIVRRGSAEELRPEALLYLLLAPETLALFPLAGLLDHLRWLEPRILYVRLDDRRDLGYQELVATDEAEEFRGFERHYDRHLTRRTLIGLTPHVQVAELWRDGRGEGDPWNEFAPKIPREESFSTSSAGRYHDATSRSDASRCVEDLIQAWDHPEESFQSVWRHSDDVHAHDAARIDARARFIGRVWVGAGREVRGESDVVGPAILWDAPEVRPVAEKVRWGTRLPVVAPTDGIPVGPWSGSGRALAAAPPGKRLFDITFALAILSVTVPFYPLILAWIWVQDGRPFFFAHRRQTLGGRFFPCLKFRTMRKDAEKIKLRLMAENQVDGPQFYIEDDPRLLRGAKWMRKFKIDELPQFINVLLGDMSVVGPRPSPEDENRFCPPWNEARLSVRGGVTGLWQVSRTREAGLDFQEWIRYDLEYVEKMSWKLDLQILWRTVIITLKGK